MEKIERILVPTDFSDCSTKAFHDAVTLARKTKATLLLAHVFDPNTSSVDRLLLGPPIFPKLKIGQALDQMAHPEREKGSLIETHLLKGDPPAEIVKAAKEFNCDLIVMGTHGRTGMEHFLMGSVVEQVIRSSAVPVLVVRPLLKESEEKVKASAA